MKTIEKLIDLVENTKPECVVTVDTGYTYEDDEGQDVEYACDVTLFWYGHYTETITNPNTIALIRKMVESGSVGLTDKNNGMVFTVSEVIFGIPTVSGWTPEDFE